MSPITGSLNPFVAWMPGWPEIVLILVLVLILFGPRKLPEVADAMGKSIQKFKAASRDASDTVKKELDDARRAVEDEPESAEKKRSPSENESSRPHQDS
jgi:TatA/E family protein of Tat protein translocase